MTHQTYVFLAYGFTSLVLTSLFWASYTTYRKTHQKLLKLKKENR